MITKSLLNNMDSVNRRARKKGSTSASQSNKNSFPSPTIGKRKETSASILFLDERIEGMLF